MPGPGVPKRDTVRTPASGLVFHTDRPRRPGTPRSTRWSVPTAFLKAVPTLAVLAIAMPPAKTPRSADFQHGAKKREGLTQRRKGRRFHGRERATPVVKRGLLGQRNAGFQHGGLAARSRRSGCHHATGWSGRGKTSWLAFRLTPARFLGEREPTRPRVFFPDTRVIRILRLPSAVSARRGFDFSTVVQSHSFSLR